MQTEQQKQHEIAKDANFIKGINDKIKKAIGDKKISFGIAYETENMVSSAGNFPPAIIEDLAFKYAEINPDFEKQIVANFLERQKDNIQTNVIPMVKLGIEIFKPLLENVSNNFLKTETVEQKEETPIVPLQN